MKYTGMPRPLAKAKEPSLDTGRDEHRINRVNKTYIELKQQDETFRSTLDFTKDNMDKFIEDLYKKPIKRVALIGCGDSLFVGSTVEILIEKLLGCVCQSYDAYEFYTSRCDVLDEHTIVIGQSASGTTQSVLGALDKAKEKKAYTIGISNTEHAEILTNADFGLLIQAKRSGWPTQATTSAIGAIAYVFATLSMKNELNVEYAESILRELAHIPDKINKALVSTEDEIKNKVINFKDALYFQTTGSGGLYGAAQVACAKLRELCPVHASAYPIEEFHHYRSLKQNDPLILFLQGGQTNQKEIDTALVGAYDGGKIIVIGDTIPSEISQVSDLSCVVPKTISELQPIVSMVAAHLFAYHLAKLKFALDIGYPSGE